MSIRRTALLLCLLSGPSNALWAETDLEKATRLIKNRSFPEAQVLLDRTVQGDPRNAEAWFLMGELQLATQDPRRAVEFADKAIQINPAKAIYHVLRGNSLGNLALHANVFRALGLASDARASLEKAVQLEPGNRTAFGALFNYYLNVPAIAGGGLDKAQVLAERTQILDPSRGHYLKGQVLQKQKDLRAARSEYLLALADDPQFAYVYNVLGYLALESKQVDAALDHFRRQVELDPGNANCYDSLGDGLVAKGRLDEAISAYRKALAVNPLFFASMRSLGKALEQAGRRDEAIQHYRQCVQLGVQNGIPQVVSDSKERLKALGIER